MLYEMEGPVTAGRPCSLSLHSISPCPPLPAMESKEKSPVGSPRSPVASPGRETTPKSPVGSPGEEEAPGSPERSVASPTSGNLLPGNYWTEAPPVQLIHEHRGGELYADRSAA